MTKEEFSDKAFTIIIRLAMIGAIISLAIVVARMYQNHAKKKVVQAEYDQTLKERKDLLNTKELLEKELLQLNVDSSKTYYWFSETQLNFEAQTAFFEHQLITRMYVNGKEYNRKCYCKSGYGDMIKVAEFSVLDTSVVETTKTDDPVRAISLTKAE